MKSEQYKKTIGLVLASDPKKIQNFHKIGPLVREKKIGPITSAIYNRRSIE